LCRIRASLNGLGFYSVPPATSWVAGPSAIVKGMPPLGGGLRLR
jgi:hypothetical protein